MFRRNFKEERWNLQTRPGPKKSTRVIFFSKKKDKIFLDLQTCHRSHNTGLWQTLTRLLNNAVEKYQDGFSRAKSGMTSHPTVDEELCRKKEALFCRTWDQEWDESYVPGREPNSFLDQKKVRWDPAVWRVPTAEWTRISGNRKEAPTPVNNYE